MVLFVLCVGFYYKFEVVNLDGMLLTRSSGMRGHTVGVLLVPWNTVHAGGTTVHLPGVLNCPTTTPPVCSASVQATPSLIHLMLMFSFRSYDKLKFCNLYDWSVYAFLVCRGSTFIPFPKYVINIIQYCICKWLKNCRLPFPEDMK